MILYVNQFFFRPKKKRKGKERRESYFSLGTFGKQITNNCGAKLFFSVSKSQYLLRKKMEFVRGKDRKVFIELIKR